MKMINIEPYIHKDEGSDASELWVNPDHIIGVANKGCGVYLHLLDTDGLIKLNKSARAFMRLLGIDYES